MTAQKAYCLIVLIVSAIFTISTRVEAIGVCYGTLGDNLPPPAEVVAMFKSNGIDSMRIYNPNHDILGALAGSGIALIVQFLVAHGSPLLINIYPYYAYTSQPDHLPLSYALFNSTGVVERDGKLGYQNLFDAMVDTFVAALEKAGGGNVGLVVSEIGWPSNGAFGANADSARVFNQNLIDHVSKGTPRRPGVPIETYLFGMFNENQKGPAEIEKFFGLFYPDKTPVYPIRFV
ncbi:glucan endo-1,3-beta-glucosidase-like [Zingiber officinale]|uniref:glucan endo-1,3-beta-glucosidase-like n=1 Tax=Zingiber officinale TaxID=94328 RepID=UPI001C4BE415|nr:glucan endo-1,3-beta-glucosidase-like [Zingiber officinale]